MANEFKHKDPGAELTQAEFITSDGTGHIFASQAAARGAALPTRDAPVKKDREPVVVQCEECATEFDGYNKMVATNRLKAHTKKEHGDTDGK